LSVINSKKRTFKKLWGKLKYISGPILEVGCSAGFSLRVALDMGLDIYGLEVNKNVIESLSGQGISADRISVNGLRAFVNKRFEAVAFFDSFEHLPDPRGFLSELTAYLLDGAYIIIVLPNGGSISRKVLGRYWPHYVIDHWVHYTLRGIRMLLSVYNIKIINSFYPIKDVSLEMIIRHMVIHRNLPINILDKFRIVSSLRFPFNIGEIGLICRYNREARKLI
jgi:SAM-dependent methyltransferase